MNRMLLVLAPSASQRADLERFLTDVQTPGSLDYHRWLKPDEFGRRFGPADSQISVITSWLRDEGFTAVHVSKGRTAIEFSGTTETVERAFATPIHRFAINGREFWAVATEPSIPASIAGPVRGFVGLDNFRAPVTPKHNVPGSTDHAISPGDFAIIYNINPLYKTKLTGAGVNIAVITDSNLAIQDIIQFRNETGLSPNAPQLIFNGQPAGYIEDEPTLDATWSGAIAPDARIKVIVSAGTVAASGVDLSELYAVDNNAGDIISESYSACEPEVSSAHMQELEALRAQAAAQGITWVVAAGDAGAYGCIEFHTVFTFPAGSTPAVNARASSPYVVAVGGTQFDDAAMPQQFWAQSDSPGLVSALSYIPEIPWDDSCGTADLPCPTGVDPNLRAGSGGPSRYYPKPTWQSGVSGIPADGQRDVPDIAFTASGIHDGYLLCFQASCAPGTTLNTLEHVGGTSAATPSFAGIMALIVQNEGQRQGAIQPVLYRLAAAQSTAQCDASNETVLPASTCVFNDVTRGSTALAGGEPTLYVAAPGYDLATGLGSINVTNLANQWDASKLPTKLTLTASPLYVPQGRAVTLQATLNANSSGSAPTGTVTFFVGPNPLGDPVTITSQPSATPTATVTITVALLEAGGNAITASYSGDQTYMPSVAPVQIVEVSSSSADCAVTEFAARPNPIPVAFGDDYGATTIFANAACDYDIRIGSPSGPLFTSFSQSAAPTTGFWVADSTRFFLQARGDTSVSGTLATVTVRLAEADQGECVVNDFEATPNPIIHSSSPGGTTIIANATCGYDVRIGSSSGRIIGSGTGAMQFATGNIVVDNASFFLQRQGDITPQGTVQTFSIRVVPTP
jgi:subtilase family serine protease